MVNRREYSIGPILINKLSISKVIVDPHYEEKHASSIDDKLILKLVTKLDGTIQLPEAEMDGFKYFVTLLKHDQKQYRLIWLLESDKIYIGIVNAFRDSKGE